MPENSQDTEQKQQKASIREMIKDLPTQEQDNLLALIEHPGFSVVEKIIRQMEMSKQQACMTYLNVPDVEDSQAKVESGGVLALQHLRGSLRHWADRQRGENSSDG